MVYHSMYLAWVERDIDMSESRLVRASSCLHCQGHLIQTLGRLPGSDRGWMALSTRVYIQEPEAHLEGLDSCVGGDSGA